MPSPVHYDHVIAFTEDVKVVANLQGPVSAFPKITGVTETVDRLYLQNPKNKDWGGFRIESSVSGFVSFEFGLRKACSIIQNSVCPPEIIPAIIDHLSVQVFTELPQYRVVYS